VSTCTDAEPSKEEYRSVSTFVLVHGSWHDRSVWNPVINRLQHHGHNAFGPTVAGHGKGACRQVGHAQSTRSIVDFLVSPDLTDIVLLGHSYGGTIVSKVVEKFPNVFGGSSSGTALCSATGRAYLRRCRRIIARCLNSLRNQPELVSAGVRRRMPGPVRPL
jgi:pimeloyl-ACP methyl ester carboxylesterase